MHEVFAINGSPRRNKNTASMLDSFLDGVDDIGDFQTERIDLFDYNIRGCTSCFACKRKDPNTYGKCKLNDDVSKILERISNADGVVFGSPIYFSNITGQMLCFLERLLYPQLSYERNYRILTPKRMRTAFIYTMNVTEEDSIKFNYPQMWDMMENYICMIFSQPERICSYYTYQFDNYGRYHAEAFDESDRARHRDMEFPKDLERSYDAGVRMAMAIKSGPVTVEDAKDVKPRDPPSDPQECNNSLLGSWRISRHYGSSNMNSQSLSLPN